MIHFECDYTEGAHPLIMQRLLETNMEQTIGYSEDSYCEHARELIKKACNREDADVHFLVGGTQTNMTVIASALRPHQGAVAASSGHINVHETGAVEATGHKVLPIPSEDGKITAQAVKELVEAHWADDSREHTVQPGLVYISQPTENGTHYTKEELEELYKVCQEKEIFLFVDGARLGYYLASPVCDMTLEDLANLSDVFYIGGTKVGALFGEAVVITNPLLKKDFRYAIKQHGGMFAKGRLLGIQFETLFTDDLYTKISKHAMDCALKIRKAFTDKGVKLLYDSMTNQQYPILPNDVYEALSKKYDICFWCKPDDQHTAVRVCTSWATTEENVNALCEDIDKLFM